MQQALPQLDRLFRSSDNGHVDASGMQSSDSDKGAEKAAGIVCNVKTANCKSLSKNVKKMLRLRER